MGQEQATPLRRYLQRFPDLTAADFGRRLAEELGREPSPQVLSHWVRGVSAPSAEAQLAMEKITGGAITCRSWAEWKAAQQQ